MTWSQQQEEADAEEKIDRCVTFADHVALVVSERKRAFEAWQKAHQLQGTPGSRPQSGCRNWALKFWALMTVAMLSYLSASHASKAEPSGNAQMVAKERYGQ